MSTLKVNNLQVGQDGTATNNYTLYQPASPDGTVRLGYGVAGSVTDILTLKNSRLGIGTDNPSSILHLQDGNNTVIHLGNTSYDDGVIQYFNGSIALKTGSSNGDRTFQVHTAGTEKLRIDSDGRIGINAFNNTAYDINADDVLIASDGNTGITIRSVGSTPFGMIHFADGTTGNSQKRAGRIVYQHDGDNLMFNTADTEKVRISGDGKVYFGNFASAGAKSYILKESSGDYKFNIFASESTTDNRVITVNSRSNVEALRISADAIPRVGINTTGPNALLTVGPVDSPTFYRGTAAIKATNDDNSIDTCLYLEEASGAEGWQLSVASNGELNFHNSGASTYTLKLGDDDLVTARALHVTHNITPTSGRGVEIFEAAAGVGQISSFNRDSNSWDELRLKGSEVAIYTGTSNSLGLYLQSTQSTLYGTSDGILNLDTTDGRGSFMRFKENGTSKGWVGCSEGLGTGGDQDDLGIRAVGDILLRAGARKVAKFFTSGAVSFHVNSDSHETFRFTTQGSNEAKLIMKDASSNNDIVLNTGGDTFFQGGNVAIGHNSPDSVLHLRKDSTDTNFTNETTPSTESGMKIANLSTTVGSWTAVTLSVSNGSSTQNGSIIAKSVSGGTRPEIHIAQRNGNYTESKITIDGDGNVGINDSNPSRTLSVAGSMNLASGSRIESYSSGGNLIIQGGSTWPGGHLKMYGGSSDDKIEFCTSGVSGSSTVRFRLESNGSIRLTPEGSTANPNARIDTSGDYLRLVTMKDGSGGCGLKIETQDGGAVSEKFTVESNGKIRHSGGHGNQGGNLNAGAYYRIVASNTINASSSRTFIFAGLQSGWMTIRGGGYSNAGQSQFAVMYQLGGYMTATNKYDVVTVQQWGSGVTISVQKNASDYRVTLTNNSGSYGLAVNWCVEGSTSVISVAY